MGKDDGMSGPTQVASGQAAQGGKSGNPLTAAVAELHRQHPDQKDPKVALRNPNEIKYSPTGRTKR